MATDLSLPNLPLTVCAGDNAVYNSRWLLAYHRKCGGGGEEASDTSTGITAPGKLAHFSKSYRDLNVYKQ